MRKRFSFGVMVLLVSAALFGGLRQAEAASCWQNYQACLSACGSNTTCRVNCFELYNVCRYY